MPELTNNLLRAKYRDLKKGVDNLQYIEKAIQLEREKRENREAARSKYDYTNKAVVAPDSQVKPS